VGIFNFDCHPIQTHSDRHQDTFDASLLLLQFAGLRDHRHEALADESVELGDVLVLARGHRVPQRQELLTGDGVGEGGEVLRLVGGELVVLAEVANLLDDLQDLLGRDLGDLLFDLLPAVDDVLGGDDRVVALDEVHEGDRRGHPDVSHRDGVEARREGTLVSATEVRRGHSGIRQRLREAGPRALRGHDRPGFHGLRRAQVLGVVADEVDDAFVHLHFGGPVDPVLRRRDKVPGDEPVEEGRVHLIDAVLGAVVHGREHQGLRVETPPLDLTVEDELEGTVLDTRRGAVDLVQEEDAGLGASLVQPIRRGERRDPSGLDLLVVGDADQVAFREEREAHVEEALPGALGDISGHGALADTVRAAKQHGVLDERQDNRERAKVNRILRGTHGILSPSVLGFFLLGRWFPAFRTIHQLL